MRTSTNFKIVPQLRQIALAFESEGYEFYFVGGFVRDTLMISTSRDVDATTDARPSEIKRILRSDFTYEIDAMYTVGEKYGTIGVKLGTLDLEITTYRTEQYDDGSRKPEVEYGDSLYEDLARRDFTMNAIACDKDANIIDPFGGLDDIKKGEVRFVGKPYERIAEDPLRLLRYVRFAARYNMGVPHLNAVRVDSSYILEVSKERVRDELCKILMDQYPSNGIRLLKSAWILHHVLREVDRLDTVEQISEYHYEDAFEHTMRVLDNSEPYIIQRLSALLHDTGKFGTIEYKNNPERTTFYGHEQESARITHRVLHRLRFPHTVVNAVTHIVSCHMRPLQMYNEIDEGKTPSRKALRRFIKACQHDTVGVEDVLLLNHADMAGHANPVMENWNTLDDLVRHVRFNDAFQPEQAESPLDGNELMDLFDNKPGPGPWIGATKEHLTNLVVDGIIEVDDKDGAKREALRFWNHTE